MAALGLQAEVLTLQNCVEKAIKTHPDVRIFLLKAQKAHKGLEIAKRAWYPKVSAYAEYDPQRTYVMPQNGTFHTIDENGWTAGVGVTQKIFDFAKTSHAVESAQKSYEIGKLSLKEAKALMRYRVRVAYAGILVQQAALKARRKDLEAKKALYNQAKALVRQGLKTRADESRFLASVKQAEEALAAARAGYEKAKIALEQYIGEPLPKSATFQTDILQNPGHASTLKEILRNNLDLKIAQTDEAAALARMKEKHAEHFGSVEAFADANHFDTLSRYDTTTLGVRYSVPLYSGGIVSIQEQQERIGHMLATEASASKTRIVTQQVRDLLADLKAVQKRIEARKAQIEAAKQTQKLIEARYEAGVATYMEVLDAQALWLDARLGLIGAYFDRAQAFYRLEYLNGK